MQTADIDRAWERLASADRYALVGHDRDELTPTERAQFSRMAQNAAGSRSER